MEPERVSGLKVQGQESEIVWWKKISISINIDIRRSTKDFRSSNVCVEEKGGKAVMKKPETHSCSQRQKSSQN